jgi:hypothetical protein
MSLAGRSEIALDLSAPPAGGRAPGKRRVLALGRPPDELAGRLRRPELVLTVASSLADFIALLASRRFDAIIAHPDEAGLHAARMVKLDEMDESVPPELQATAIEQNRRTPLFLLPLPGEVEFALIVAPPSLIYLYLESTVPIDRAIMNVDVAAILRAAPS